MEAKDTVLSRLEQFRIVNEYPAEELCKRQADVSFKTGFREGMKMSNVVKCKVCGVECDGDSALTHMKETEHNSWELIYPPVVEKERS